MGLYEDAMAELTGEPVKVDKAAERKRKAERLEEKKKFDEKGSRPDCCENML
jgi:hypothetical protein